MLPLSLPYLYPTCTYPTLIIPIWDHYICILVIVDMRGGKGSVHVDLHWGRLGRVGVC